MRKTIFKKWYDGKPPTLQIRILQSITSSGQTSKKKAALDLDANYPVISDAMKALIKRDFIRFSHVNKASRNPEKFYKITGDGLKALLSEDKLTPQEFWKAAALLCISSEGNKFESQFLDFYGLHENDWIGVSTRRNLLPSWFFDDILRLWSDINNIVVSADNFHSTPLPQQIIESLAFDGPMSLKKLVERTDAREEDIVRVLNSYSVKPCDILKLNIQPCNKMEIRKKTYEDFTSHLLIYAHVGGTKTTYELSIFGVMLAIALSRYRHIGMNKNLPINSFFHRDKKMEEYYRKIALNYKEKLPLIFGRWDLIRSQLGYLLYSSFDYLIFEKDRSNLRDTSVWLDGNREFYDEVQNMAHSTHAYEKLLVMHAIGKDMIQKYQQYGYKILPLQKKIREIQGELFITQILSSVAEGKPCTSAYLEVSEDSMKKIEEVFAEEVSFLFYLNLNTYKFPSSYDSFFNVLAPKNLEDIRTIYYNESEFRLGSPRQRLMSVLSKDNAIREWLLKQTNEILSYRNQVSENMSEFCNQISKPQSYKERHVNTTREESKKSPLTMEFTYEEHDITKICSDIVLPYEY